MTLHVLLCPAYRDRRSYTESRHIYIEVFVTDLYKTLVESQKEFLSMDSYNTNDSNDLRDLSGENDDCEDVRSEVGVELRCAILSVVMGILEALLDSYEKSNDTKCLEFPDFDHLMKLLYRVRKDGSVKVRVSLLQSFLKILYERQCMGMSF